MFTADSNKLSDREKVKFALRVFFARITSAIKIILLWFKTYFARLNDSEEEKYNLGLGALTSRNNDVIVVIVPWLESHFNKLDHSEKQEFV